MYIYVCANTHAAFVSFVSKIMNDTDLGYVKVELTNKNLTTNSLVGYFRMHVLDHQDKDSVKLELVPNLKSTHFTRKCKKCGEVVV